MSTSSVPAVVDYLVSMFTTATSSLTYNGSPVQVYDGPTGPNQADLNWVIVGAGTDAEASNAVQRQYFALGAQRREEEYVVVCYVVSRVGGADQKSTRDAAFGIFDALETALRADVMLGGAVNTWPVEITTQTVKQTAPNETARGRYTQIEFGVRVHTRY